MRRPATWDVFCRVVDNFGDAAVCWRLAQQLSAEHDGRVRLWIDRLEALQALCPEVASGQATQQVAGVEILLWSEHADFDAPADVAIEAFGCGLPDAYAEAMARRAPATLWIVLEYLSAEPWVASHHGLPSPHPRLPLERYFFFPGVAPGTGGILREASLESRRDAFQADAGRQAQFWRSLGFEPPGATANVISLFGYENAAAGELLQACAEGTRECVVVVPRNRLEPQVSAFLGASPRRGRLEVRFVPFLPQARYDELLWACDWNFVRGEDSFVRAQWALRPLVWQAYPQQENAHLKKLEAAWAAYGEGLAPPASESLGEVWRLWNASGPSQGRLGSAWRSLEKHGDSLRLHARAWAARLAAPGELAANLAQFCSDRLK